MEGTGEPQVLLLMPIGFMYHRPAKEYDKLKGMLPHEDVPFSWQRQVPVFGEGRKIYLNVGKPKMLFPEEEARRICDEHNAGLDWEAFCADLDTLGGKNWLNRHGHVPAPYKH